MIPPAPATVKEIDISLRLNASNVTLFYMNGESFRGDYGNPTLLLTKLGNTSYPYNPEWNYLNFGSNSSIRIILKNTTPLPHPMHIHGHVFWVLAEGVGNWTGEIVNAANPQRRDVQILQGGSPTSPGYLVLEFIADNPGIWPLHCHISWQGSPRICIDLTQELMVCRHISNGLFVQLVERPADIMKLPVPSTIAQTCRDWAIFAGHDVVDQIDSGL